MGYFKKIGQSKSRVEKRCFHKKKNTSNVSHTRTGQVKNLNYNKNR